MLGAYLHDGDEVVREYPYMVLQPAVGGDALSLCLGLLSTSVCDVPEFVTEVL